MGAHYIKVRLPDGEAMHVEVEDEDEDAGDIASSPLRSVDGEELRRQISETCRWLATSVKDSLPGSPDSVDLEFGIKITAETGAVFAALAKAGAEATLLVRLQWNSAETSDG